MRLGRFLIYFQVPIRIGFIKQEEWVRIKDWQKYVDTQPEKYKNRLYLDSGEEQVRIENGKVISVS